MNHTRMAQPITVAMDVMILFSKPMSRFPLELEDVNLN